MTGIDHTRKRLRESLVIKYSRKSNKLLISLTYHSMPRLLIAFRIHLFCDNIPLLSQGYNQLHIQYMLRLKISEHSH